MFGKKSKNYFDKNSKKKFDINKLTENLVKPNKITKERKKNQLAKQELEKEKVAWEEEKPAREKEVSDFQTQQVSNKTAESKAERQASREEGRKRAEELFSKPQEGLDPATKSALQYEASSNIDRNMQNANRKLLGEQGMHGISGKSGVAFAQQKDLQRLGQEAQGQATRDLNTLDRKLAMQKLASMLALEQGEVSENQLDKQRAKDEIELMEEKKWQRKVAEQLNELFSRI